MYGAYDGCRVFVGRSFGRLAAWQDQGTELELDDTLQEVQLQNAST